MTGGRRPQVRTVWRCRTAYRSAAFGLGNGLSCLRFPSQYRGHSVWSRGRDHRIVTAAGTIAFPSPFGMT